MGETVTPWSFASRLKGTKKGNPKGKLKEKMESYGTLSEPLVVEAELSTRVAELKSEVRSGKWMVLLGLFVSMIFCIATFAMVCVATEYTKEVVVIDSALMDKKTSTIVSTREHEEEINDPINNAAGVKWITFFHNDGGITRTMVYGYEKVKCTAETAEDNCVDGFHYIFNTADGDYAAKPVIDADFKPAITFRPVADDFLKSVKANTPASSEGSFASGYEHGAKLFN